jgi:hypothetical protein
MKSLIWMAVLGAAWVWGSGYWAFREASVNELLEKWEDATRRGDAQVLCDTFTPDMTYSIHETTTGRLQEQEGDRAEMCAYLQKVLPPMAKAVTAVSVKRDNIVATRHGLHWWTANVSYTEHRDTTIGSALHLKTICDDRLILVKGFDGVHVKRLESENRLDR